MRMISRQVAILATIRPFMMVPSSIKSLLIYLRRHGSSISQTKVNQVKVVIICSLMSKVKTHINLYGNCNQMHKVRAIIQFRCLRIGSNHQSLESKVRHARPFLSKIQFLASRQVALLSRAHIQTLIYKTSKLQKNTKTVFILIIIYRLRGECSRCLCVSSKTKAARTALRTQSHPTTKLSIAYLGRLQPIVKKYEYRSPPRVTIRSATFPRIHHHKTEHQ